MIENGRTWHGRVCSQKRTKLPLHSSSTGMCVTTEYFHQLKISEDQHCMFTSPHHVLELGILGNLFLPLASYFECTDNQKVKSSKDSKCLFKSC